MIKTTEGLIEAAPGTAAFDMHDHYAGNLYEYEDCSTVDVTKDVLDQLFALSGVIHPVNKYAYVIDHEQADGLNIIVLAGYYDDHARLITITA